MKIGNNHLSRLRAYFYSLYKPSVFAAVAALTAMNITFSYAATSNHPENIQSGALPQRDPFTTSDLMYSEVGNPQRAGGAQGFVPGYGPQTAPKMRLKGFMNRGAKKMVALLEVEGAGVYLVSEGDEIGLQTLGQNAVIKVVKIDINGVRVQAGRVNQVILVR
ncbi:hypothetical protein [Methylotenera sp. L2L1]|uniref:hypothetical protein n=1 Tax=Methylotenera sp. L2L1 TaxID=1502770 RepID=UPI000690E0C2|nr:hypothetical protein [Methylotenera sp. L2L1]